MILAIMKAKIQMPIFSQFCSEKIVDEEIVQL